MSQLNVKSRTLMLAKMALMVAIAFICTFIRFPLLPTAPWMEFEFSMVPILISCFVFGPIPGLAIGVVALLLRALILSPPNGLYGLIMSLISAGVYVVVAGIIYQKTKPQTERVQTAAFELTNLIDNSPMSAEYSNVLAKQLKAVMNLIIGKWGLIALVAGGLCMTAAMLPANLIITPLFLGVPTEAVLVMIPTTILPFNILKMVINTVVVFMLYKRLSPFLHRWE